MDPTLRVTDVRRLNEVTKGFEWIIGLWLKATLTVTGGATAYQ